MKYNIYIPSKGRCDNSLTADLFLSQNVPFRLVVEDQEYSQYSNKFGEDKMYFVTIEQLELLLGDEEPTSYES